MRRVHLVADEDIAALPPGRVGPPHESPPEQLPDAPVRGGQIVLELRADLRIRGTATAHPVADIEDHEPVVPVREIRKPVDDHDVVEIPPRLSLLGLPAGDLLAV